MSRLFVYAKKENNMRTLTAQEMKELEEMQIDPTKFVQVVEGLNQLENRPIIRFAKAVETGDTTSLTLSDAFAAFDAMSPEDQQAYLTELEHRWSTKSI